METYEKSVSRRARKLNRREFMGTSAAAAAFTIVPGCVLGRGGHPAPSEKINLAFVGVGDQGMGNMGDLQNLDDTQVIAVCDVDRRVDYGQMGHGIAGLDEALRRVERRDADRTNSNSYKGCTGYGFP